MIGLMMTRKGNNTTEEQREEKTNKARDLKLENYDERFMTFRTEGYFVSSLGNVSTGLCPLIRGCLARDSRNLEAAVPLNLSLPIHYTQRCVSATRTNAPL